VLCPVGALVALVSRFSWLAVSMDTGQCKSCKVCDRQCPMDVKVEAKKHTDGKINRDAECIGCLTCETVCTKSAISNNSRLLKKGDA
jgi:polyferredoxin